MLRMVRKMKPPGASANHGAVVSVVCDVRSMLPQDGVGSWMPSPRNDSADSVSIAPPTPNVAATITGPIALGKIWRHIKRCVEAPTARAAIT
jgi:hypothetical protein